MINLIMIVALMAPQFDTIDMPIRVIFITPTGEYTTAREESKVMNNIHKSIDWWNSVSPVTINSVITETVFMTSTADIFTNPLSIYNHIDVHDGVLNVVVVDNTKSRSLFIDGRSGLGIYRSAIIIPTDHDNIKPVITHEMGHMYFDLPDLYISEIGCDVYDIMCNPYTSYPNNTIGCTSLSNMGYPCRRIYIPIVQA